MNKPIIFISHITEEKELALELKKIIKKKFLSMAEVFVSSDENSIELGHEWLENITNGLKTCSIELILCSPVSISRPWINFEAGAGWVRKDCRVIPICHSNMQPDSLPLPLNLLQGMMLNDKIKFQELLKIIANQIGCDAPELDCGDFITFVKAFEEKYTYWNIVNNLMQKFIALLSNYGSVTLNGNSLEGVVIKTLLENIEMYDFCLNNNFYDNALFENLSKMQILSVVNTSVGMNQYGYFNYFKLKKLANFDNVVQNDKFIYCIRG